MTECVERSWRSILILGLLGALLDKSRYFFGTRFVDGMARALDHDHVAVGARGIEPLQVNKLSLPCRHGAAQIGECQKWLWYTMKRTVTLSYCCKDPQPQPLLYTA